MQKTRAYFKNARKRKIMPKITVAVVENNPNRREQLEQYLKQNDQNIEVLSDQKSFYDTKMERRLKSRDNLSFKENTVARIKRLKPRVIFVNTQQLTKESCELLFEVHQNCPDTLPVVLVKELSADNHVLQALRCGARGIVDCGSMTIDISKVIQAVDKGEPWVSRKILTKMMEKIVFTTSH